MFTKKFTLLNNCGKNSAKDSIINIDTASNYNIIYIRGGREFIDYTSTCNFHPTF